MDLSLLDTNFPHHRTRRLVEVQIEKQISCIKHHVRATQDTHVSLKLTFFFDIHIFGSLSNGFVALLDKSFFSYHRRKRPVEVQMENQTSHASNVVCGQNKTLM
jgi:hypothetical protein